MKAVRVANFGGPEVLQVLKGIAVPKPSSREVLLLKPFHTFSCIFTLHYSKHIVAQKLGFTFNDHKMYVDFSNFINTFQRMISVLLSSALCW